MANCRLVGKNDVDLEPLEVHCFCQANGTIILSASMDIKLAVLLISSCFFGESDNLLLAHMSNVLHCPF